MKVKGLAVALVGLGFIFASSQAPDAKKILENTIHRKGFKDIHLKIKLTKTKAGVKKQIELDLYQKRYPEMIATLVIIQKPEPARGISFLTWDYFDPKKPDKKWYYLPAINQYKALNDEQGKRYEEKFGFSMDIFTIDLEQAEHHILGEEKLNARLCYKIESIAKDPDNPKGARIITWVNKKTGLAEKIQAYDKTGKLIREFNLLDEKAFDHFWQEMAGKYEDFVKKQVLEFKVVGVELNKGLKDELFLSTRMKKRAEQIQKTR